jgi:hypothetical protein
VPKILRNNGLKKINKFAESITVERYEVDGIPPCAKATGLPSFFREIAEIME